MKTKITLILLTFSLLAFSQDYPKKTIGGKEYYVYVVQAGDGLMAIGRKFGVTQAEIMAANPNISESLKVEQTIYIPVKSSFQPTQPSVNQQNNTKEVFEHIVAKSQTFFAICKMYGVSQEEVAALNQGLEPTQIKVGQVIKIPVKKQQEVRTAANSEQKEQAKPQTQPKVENNEKFTYYEVKKNKETLYSISKELGVSINEILELNPEAENGVKKGDVLQIPVVEKVLAAQTEKPKNEPKSQTETPKNEPKKQETPQKSDKSSHVVKPKETIYGISKQYNVSQDDLIAANPQIKNGLKIGQTLVIPQGTQEIEIAVVETPKPQAEPKTEPITAEPTKKQLKIAFLLPFTNVGYESIDTERFINFYRGALLALEEAKKQGVSVDVQTFDTGLGTGSLNRILAEKSLTGVDLIIGPAYPEQISAVAAFAKKNRIAQVVPFSSKINNSEKHEHLYQFNPASDDILQAVAESFIEKFAKHNIIFVNFADKNDKGAKFADILKSNLRAKSIQYADARNTDAIAVSLKNQNNIVVFATNNYENILPMLPAIKEMKNSLEFWATDEVVEKLPELEKSYFYSLFNNNVSENYLQQYQKWFGGRVCSTTPCYDLLGYDITYYFCSANYNSLNSTFTGIRSAFFQQSAFNFLPQKSGKGYLNYGYFLNCNDCK